jgi:hypothetical protein
MKKSVNRKNRDYQLYCVRFAMEANQRNELFDELTKYNEELENPVTGSDDMTRLESGHFERPSDSANAMSTAVSNIWRQADRLYEVLFKTWSYACDNQYGTNVFLEHPTVTDLQFTLLFIDNKNISNTIAADTS